MNSQAGSIVTTYSRAGIAAYSLEIWHTGLGKRRVLRGGDIAIVTALARSQRCDWDALWQTKRMSDQKRSQAAHTAQEREEKTEDEPGLEFVP